MLRELFRHLQQFEELFRTEGVDTLIGPDGTYYSIFDLKELYRRRDELLSPQRARAIEYFLYHDMREQDAAEATGLSKKLVAVCATQGLKQLAAAWTEGAVWVRGDGAVPAETDAVA